MSDDKKDDKKTDKVISMSEFLQEVPKEDKLQHTAEETFAYILSTGAKKVVVISENAEGQMGFFSNAESYVDILFALEAYKKIVMDSVIGFKE